jgi:hypothetical protein
MIAKFKQYLRKEPVIAVSFVIGASGKQYKISILISCFRAINIFYRKTNTSKMWFKKSITTSVGLSSSIEFKIILY